MEKNKYVFRLRRQATEIAEVVIEAKSQDEAEATAYALVMEGESSAIDWALCDVSDADVKLVK